MGEKVVYDNGTFRAIDEAMGWVEEGGSCPSKTADDHGCDGKFMGGLFSATAWRKRKTGLWSVCILNYHGITTTLLAKSFRQLERMYRKLHERCGADTREVNQKRWQPYYKALWARRYRR